MALKAGPKCMLEAQKKIKKAGYKSYIAAVKEGGPPYETFVQTDGLDVRDGVMLAVPFCCKALKEDGVSKTEAEISLHALIDRFINEIYGDNDEKVIDNSGVLN